MNLSSYISIKISSLRCSIITWQNSQFILNQLIDYEGSIECRHRKWINDAFNSIPFPSSYRNKQHPLVYRLMKKKRFFRGSLPSSHWFELSLTHTLAYFTSKFRNLNYYGSTTTIPLCALHSRYIHCSKILISSRHGNDWDYLQVLAFPQVLFFYLATSNSNLRDATYPCYFERHLFL